MHLIGSFLRCWDPRVHGHTPVRHRKGRGVIGPVSYHRNNSRLALFPLDDVILVLRFRLRLVLVNPPLRRYALGGERLIASYHNRPNAHHLDRHDLLPDIGFENVSQPCDSDRLSISRKRHSCVSSCRYVLNDPVIVCGNRFDNFLDGIWGAFDNFCLIGSDRDAALHMGFEFSPQPSSLSASPSALWKHESSPPSQFDTASAGAGAELVDLRGV